MELVTTMKMLYLPIVSAALFALLTSKDDLFSVDLIEKLLVFYGVLIVLSIVIGDVSGLGGNISGRGEGIEASKGFLIGANEVG